MVGASVITLALIALPVMLDQGFQPSYAAGSVAAAGALGVALPPGVMLFFLSESMGVFSPYVFLAMVGPSILLIMFYCAYCAGTGWFGPSLAPRSVREHKAESRVSMVSVFRSLALPVGLAVAIQLLVTVG